jgi:hypothetical protein
MPNSLAHLALYSYPIIAFILFRRLGHLRGLIWTILLGYMFLPVRPIIDLPIPGLPYIDKVFIPAISALVFVWFFNGRKTRPIGRARPQAENSADWSEQARGTRGALSAAEPEADDIANPPRRTAVKHSKNGQMIVNALLVLAIVGPMITTLTNSEPIFLGERILRGFRLYDSGRAVVTTLVMLMPFLLARKYLNTKEAHTALIWALVLGGTAYALLALYEVRMSPTLNRKIYGFFAHDWRQHLRRGGYRPILFQQHGLRVGIFLAIGAIAVAAAIRTPDLAKHRKRLLVLLPFMIFSLWAAKSLGAVIIAVLFIPFALFAKPRSQVLLGATISMIILMYPLLRSAEIIPVGKIVEVAERIDRERADSLEVRLRNENLLLERASKKPLAGWGGQGRWGVFNEEGDRETTPDGRWVITIGQFGWLGYLSEFGLLATPLLLISFRRNRLDLPPATAGLALVLTGNMVDLIPNSALTPITWLVAGALVGWYERQMTQASPFPADMRKAGGSRRGEQPIRRSPPSS